MSDFEDGPRRCPGFAEASNAAGLGRGADASEREQRSHPAAPCPVAWFAILLRIGLLRCGARFWEQQTQSEIRNHEGLTACFFGQRESASEPRSITPDEL